MKTSPLLRRAAVAFCFVALGCRFGAAAEPVVDLLAGDDLARHWETTGNWALKDGVAVLTPRPGESGWSRWSAYLWSKEQYKDFEAEFDYKVEAKGNSGFYFHVGDKNDPVKQGIEVQIYDSASHPADKPLNDHDSGGIIPGVPPTKRTAKPAGEWNQFQVVVQAGKVTVKLNGEVVNELALDNPKIKSRPATGYIGFQDHGLPLSLRNIRVRSL
jgi:hypothetical protein